MTMNPFDTNPLNRSLNDRTLAAGQLVGARLVYRWCVRTLWIYCNSCRLILFYF